MEAEETALINAAAEAAGKAEVVILFAGTTERIESEGRDRTNLSLPGRQEELVEAVYAANPRTVLVLLNAGPLTLPWAKQHLRAIIESWWNGEEGATPLPT